MAEIHLKSLAHSYSKNPQSPQDYAIREMDHIWQQGGAYALLGPSGCGKSTLLNIISGLLAPSEGDVLFDGQRMNELAPEERNIAQVFQFPVIYDSMTVYDNLAFPLRNTKVPESKIQKKVAEIAEILEIEDLLKNRAKNLTADEKQKVSMGRGLVRDDVSAILFDEPLTVIDPNLKWKLRRKLKQIHEKFNITMVYVTHDQLEAATFADKIALMYQGQIVQFGTPRELFENPKHTFVGYFIGSPGMNILSVKPCDKGVLFNNQLIEIDEKRCQFIEQIPSNNLKVGIRPEFVEVTASSTDSSFACPVLHTEDLGTYKILTLDFFGEKIKARIEEDDAAPTSTAYIKFPNEWLKVYVDEFLLEETEDE